MRSTLLALDDPNLHNNLGYHIASLNRRNDYLELVTCTEHVDLLLSGAQFAPDIDEIDKVIPAHHPHNFLFLNHRKLVDVALG